MKVLHLPTATSGNSWGLAQGERALGLESSVLIVDKLRRDDLADINLHLEETLTLPGKLAKLAVTFLNIRNNYDVFHFNFGNPLIYIPYKLKRQLPTFFKYTDQFDLPFYPETAKLFVSYNGCDVRQKYVTMERRPIAACHNPNCYGGQCNSGRLDEYRRQGVKRMERYARHMWAITPDLLHFLPREKSSFLPHTLSHWDEVPLSLPKLGRRLKIVHAPTNREAKGSDFILAAFEKVKQRYGEAVEIQLVENVPHDEAMKIYQEADLIIDQILIGWYGAFAVEAMKMGKPVIARIAGEDLPFLPEAQAQAVQEAVINADPYTIEEVLRRCIEDRDFLRYHSEASVAYAHRWHHPNYVASLTKEKYESA